MKNDFLLTVAMLMTATCLTSVASAQTQPDPQVTTAQSAATNGLSDIIVTAQRRSESSQKAAVAISVLAPAQLAGITQPQQLTSLVPSLQIANGGGAAPLLYLRGVGTFASNPYSDSAVAINYDGVYLGRPGSANGLFYDLERLEVLKGPQGTLYGRNATGGALNVLPAKPVIGEASGFATLSYGNYDTINGQAAINIPISENAALRVSGNGFKHDGYLTDGTYSENGAGGRVQLLLKPSDTFSIRLGGDYFHVGGTGATGVIIGTRNAATGAIDSVPFGRNVGYFDPRADAILNSTRAFVAPSGAVFGSIPARPYLDNDYYGVNAEITADLGFGVLTVVPAWRRVKKDEVTLPTSYLAISKETDEQFSTEARLAGKVGPVDWLLGAFYFNESVDSIYPIAANVQAADQFINANNKSYAGFGRLTYHLSDAIRLIGAGRYTKDNKSFQGSSEAVIAICQSPTHVCSNIRRVSGNFTTAAEAMAQIGYIKPPGVPVYIDSTGVSQVVYSPTITTVNNQIKPSKFTYRVAAEFDAGTRSLLYASLETGYRSGGFSFSQVRPTYDAETITAYTIGSKNRFLDNRLQINIELFLWKYKNQQTPHFGFNATGGLEFLTENIGKSTNKGIEVEVQARPMQNTRLHADLQYLKTNLDSFIYQDPDQSGFAGLPPGTVPPVTSCPTTYVPATNTHAVNCTGGSALRSPKWTLNLGGEQTVPLSSEMKLVASFDTHFQTSSLVMFERLPVGNEGSYWKSAASLTLASTDDRYALTAFVDNIENNRISGNTFIFPLSNVVSAVTSPPRTYGIRANVRF